MRLRATATVIAPIFALVALLAVAQTYAVNEDGITEAKAALAAYIRNAQSVPLDPVRQSDLARIAPLLDQARALPYGADYNSTLVQLLPGLSQAAKLNAAARSLYRNALEHMLLPQLILRLEGQMRAHLQQPEFLYQATKVYLMLGSAGPLDRELVKDWMHLDWQSEWPGPIVKPLRDSLERHLAALLDRPLEKVPLDGALVDDARRTFSRVSLAERIYDKIKTSAAARALPSWRPSDAAGAAGVRLFTRKSGVPLSDGLPGFFTVDGFYRVLLANLPTAAQQVASESWVFGKSAQIDPSSPQVQTLQRDVIALYTEEYAKQWDALLADLDISPMLNLQEAAQALYILASPQSPLRDLLASITRQLTLTKTPPGITGAAQVPSATSTQLNGLFVSPNQPPPEPPGKVIDDRYLTLISFVGKDPGAPIDNVLRLLSDLQQQLAVRVASGRTPPTVGGDPRLLLHAEAERDPQPVSRWLDTIASNVDRLIGPPPKR